MLTPAKRGIIPGYLLLDFLIVFCLQSSAVLVCHISWCKGTDLILAFCLSAVRSGAVSLSKKCCRFLMSFACSSTDRRTQVLLDLLTGWQEIKTAWPLGRLAAWPLAAGYWPNDLKKRLVDNKGAKCVMRTGACHTCPNLGYSSNWGR